MGKQILIATGNRGKASEIISIFENAGCSGIDFILPADVGIHDSPIEDGPDYKSNSIIKARFYGEKSGLISIADDSGLEIAALEGFPGIKSARVKAPENTDKSRYEIILEMMLEVPDHERSARFMCVASAYFPADNNVIISEGIWKGEILRDPIGGSGFGYDPIFFDPNLQQTAAEIDRSEKNKYSHRGKAFRSLWQLIKDKF